MAKHMVDCPTCGGAGTLPTWSGKDCRDCGGRGEVTLRIRDLIIDDAQKRAQGETD